MGAKTPTNYNTVLGTGGQAVILMTHVKTACQHHPELLDTKQTSLRYAAMLMGNKMKDHLNFGEWTTQPDQIEECSRLNLKIVEGAWVPQFCDNGYEVWDLVHRYEAYIKTTKRLEVGANGWWRHGAKLIERTKWFHIAMREMKLACNWIACNPYSKTKLNVHAIPTSTPTKPADESRHVESSYFRSSFRDAVLNSQLFGATLKRQRDIDNEVEPIVVRANPTKLIQTKLTTSMIEQTQSGLTNAMALIESYEHKADSIEWVHTAQNRIYEKRKELKEESIARKIRLYEAVDSVYVGVIPGKYGGNCLGEVSRYEWHKEMDLVFRRMSKARYEGGYGGIEQYYEKDPEQPPDRAYRPILIPKLNDTRPTERLGVLDDIVPVGWSGLNHPRNWMLTHARINMHMSDKAPEYRLGAGLKRHDLNIVRGLYKHVNSDPDVKKATKSALSRLPNITLKHI
jgi:hypothetical protein